MIDLLFGPVDWSAMFVPKHPLIDSLVRGTVIYLCLFAIIRFVKNRSLGGVGMSDLLVIMLVANALQNGLIGRGASITEGLVSTVTVFFWSYALDWLAFRIPALRGIIHSNPVEIIRGGRMVPLGLRREMMTEEALRAQLRIGGIVDMSSVKAAYVESNGQISFLQE